MPHRVSISAATDPIPATNPHVYSPPIHPQIRSPPIPFSLHPHIHSPLIPATHPHIYSPPIPATHAPRCSFTPDPIPARARERGPFACKYTSVLVPANYPFETDIDSRMRTVRTGSWMGPPQVRRAPSANPISLQSSHVNQLLQSEDQVLTMHAWQHRVLLDAGERPTQKRHLTRHPPTHYLLLYYSHA